MPYKIISDIYKKTRQWFYNHNFIEIHTNILTKSPGWDAYFMPFKTKLSIKNTYENFYLSSSPEFEMKAFFYKGINQFFQITKSFRNNETDELHIPEFNMLEWYEKYTNYFDAMKKTEDLIHSFNIKNINYSNRHINITSPFKKISINSLFQEHLNIDLKNYQNQNDFLDIAYSKGFTHISKNASWDTIFFTLFLDKIEPKITQYEIPIFIYDYPIQIASLAKNKSDSPEFVERFELYIGGVEICNGYSELLDLEEHYNRLKIINSIRQKNHLEILSFPDELKLFCNLNLQSVSGVALGMDRLVMLLTNSKTIQDILPVNIFTRDNL